MEVTRQLLTAFITKKGLARIQLTFCWEGHRLRLPSGERCTPKQWDKRRQYVKGNPGSPAEAINATLTRWQQAGTQTHEQARRQDQALDPAQMEAAIRQRYQQLLEAETDVAELPEVAQAPPGFLDYMAQWIEHQASKVSVRTGRSLTRDSVQALRRTRAVFEEFAAATGTPLALEQLDRSFYHAFSQWLLLDQKKDVNTLSTHVKRLKNFLGWCEEQDLPVSGKYRRFEAPDVYRGVDALTQAELLRLAAIDFQQPAVQAYLASQFEPAVRTHQGGRPVVTQEEFMTRAEHARDKVLQCAYLGLRLGDADRMSPDWIQGELVKLHAGKTDKPCLIPFFDDDVFRPVALIEKYAGSGLPTCLPVVFELHRYFPLVQHLSGITRLKLGTRTGRKTFATLKIYQGMPKTQVMLATGHTTEKSFNRYLGIDEQELLSNYRKTARRVA
ncbi:site-specific integrase [Hymenobacter sp. J193]|uniref:site-specific integrase n=1 Tax=Hymenobacter sp. J193 TaxID=2898429 RepID=UPI0021512AC3|nr:site-specific integrase [Hymenobacter sp. J193]MCR5889947.1 site-specific integrase [Hymenobacter sp. J193]